MTQEQFRQLLKERSAEIQPLLEQATKAVTDAFQLGLEKGIDIGIIFTREGIER